jgi:CheY-like chemotaxis protein
MNHPNSSDSILYPRDKGWDNFRLNPGYPLYIPHNNSPDGLPAREQTTKPGCNIQKGVNYRRSEISTKSPYLLYIFPILPFYSEFKTDNYQRTEAGIRLDKILICDDDPKIVQITVAYLVKEGYQVETAGDGEDCLIKVNAARFSLVILDVTMPRMDGFQACKRIRKKMNIPIIMLTARMNESDRTLGLRSGADDYMIKPFSPRELLTRIKAQLRRYHCHAENNAVFPNEELKQIKEDKL